jgi:alpha-D-ribose 1-methylphosphonate 5-phosphate C-P lyase
MKRTEDHTILETHERFSELHLQEMLLHFQVPVPSPDRGGG